MMQHDSSLLFAHITDLPDDIMQRRCPKLQRFSHGAAWNVRVTTRIRQKPYALKVSLKAAQVTLAYACLPVYVMYPMFPAANIKS